MDVFVLLCFGAALLAAVLLGWFLAHSRMATGSASDASAIGNVGPVALHARSDADSALALFDVDDLEGVNSKNDFDTGDRLLNAIGDVLRRAIPNGAALERMESGRFLVWMPNTQLDTAVTQTEELRTLASLAHVEGREGPSHVP